MPIGVREGWYWRPGWQRAHYVRADQDRATCGTKATSGLVEPRPNDPRCAQCQVNVHTDRPVAT